MIFSCCILTFIFFPENVYSQTHTPIKLEKYNVDPLSLTVSGISSGGAMATQFHFIYSSDIHGAGIFAAGPYLCAYINILGCAAQLQAVPLYILEANLLASWGKISPVVNLNNSKVYIFHGTKDKTVELQSGKNLKTMYDKYGSDVLAEFSIPAGHGIPVDGNGYGGPCGTANPDQRFINECGYSGVFEMFKHLYGNNVTKTEKGYVANGNIIHFNQSEFGANSTISMSSKGLLYVPTACVDKTVQCRIHVAFHGCSSNEEAFGTDFVTKSQYSEVAELNNIIILFPQSANTNASPKGCWDWAGYTNRLTYPTKNGPQPSTVMKMVRRVLGTD